MIEEKRRNSVFWMKPGLEVLPLLLE